MIASAAFITLLIVTTPVMVVAHPFENNEQLGLRPAIEENRLFARLFKQTVVDEDK